MDASLRQFFDRDVPEAVIQPRHTPGAAVHLHRDHPILGAGHQVIFAVGPVGELGPIHPHLDVGRRALDARADRIPLALFPVLLPVLCRRALDVFETLAVNATHVAARQVVEHDLVGLALFTRAQEEPAVAPIIGIELEGDLEIFVLLVGKDDAAVVLLVLRRLEDAVLDPPRRIAVMVHLAHMPALQAGARRDVGEPRRNALRQQRRRDNGAHRYDFSHRLSPKTALLPGAPDRTGSGAAPDTIAQPAGAARSTRPRLRRRRWAASGSYSSRGSFARGPP